MKSWQAMLIGTLFSLLASGAILVVSMPPKGEPITLLPPPTPMPMVIQVAGEVAEPGVYALEANSRVQDAIEKAGGFTDCANEELINLAKLLTDGEKIWVPALPIDNSDSSTASPEENNSNTPESKQPSSDNPININIATQSELECLPGIGPSKAELIIQYRLQNGPFHDKEDLLNVFSIGESTLEQLSDLITLE